MKTMKEYTSLGEQLSCLIEDRGILIGKDQKGFVRTNVDVVYPYFAVSICTQGSARVLYDMQDLMQSRNELGLVLPGHILCPVSNTDDYTFTWLFISPDLITKEELLPVSNRGMKLFDKVPMCRVTDEEAQRLLTLIDQMEYVSSLSKGDLPHRDSVLKKLLSVMLELIFLYRKEQDEACFSSSHTNLYLRFTNLVVQHYKEERNVNYYATQLGYEPRYFSKLFRLASNGISPLEWIEQYVVTQAKLLMEANPQQSIKEIAYQLGFTDVANFFRYFKRGTSMTVSQYKANVTNRDKGVSML